jgi:hypothetical protein
MTNRIEIDIKGRKINFVFEEKNQMIKNLYGRLKNVLPNCS